ncbi:MAG: hypothetical protein H0T68_08460 [Gemmatimonadales bacterium]|nr:hypothetical protein [Gemmatimonadales bacterium]
MKRAKVLGAALLVGALATTPEPAGAQTSLSADLGLFRSYVWRGVSLTNRPVAQPDVYLSIPAGNASVTFGGWGNVELGRYDDVNDDISESGGLSGLDLSEFNPYAEVSFPAGKATLTGGVIGYVYPNDLTDEANAGLDSDYNTVELYGTVGFDVPLSPSLSVYYDLDKIDGAYIEGNVSHSLAAGENLSIDLGALAGFSAGQDCEGNILAETCTNRFNFEDNGLTHVDLSAGISFAAGALAFTPQLRLVLNADDATKVTSPSELDSDAKLWGGVMISWSQEFGGVVEEE